MNVSAAPRYDRIVSLVLLVLFGLAVVLFIDINPNILRARLGGDLPVITVSWLLIASLVVIISTGADVFIRSHPQMQTRQLPTLRLGRFELELAPGFWILPSLSIVASFAFFRLYSASLQNWAFILALAVAGGLLLATMIAQHYGLDRQTELRQRAQTVLQVAALLIAFAIFSAVYYARMRTLYSAALIGGAGALLAYGLLHWVAARRSVVIISGLVGLALAETTFALNYWAAPFLLGGALLLVVFYISYGLLYHYLEGTLGKSLYVEYGVLGAVLLTVVVWVTFG